MGKFRTCAKAVRPSSNAQVSATVRRSSFVVIALRFLAVSKITRSGSNYYRKGTVPAAAPPNKWRVTMCDFLKKHTNGRFHTRFAMGNGRGYHTDDADSESGQLQQLIFYCLCCFSCLIHNPQNSQNYLMNLGWAGYIFCRIVSRLPTR